MFKSIYTLNDFNVIAQFPFKISYFNRSRSSPHTLILRLGGLWINQKHVFLQKRHNDLNPPFKMV